MHQIDHRKTFELAFQLHQLDRETILQSIENVGDFIVRDHANLGVTRAEAYRIACRVCSEILAHVTKLRQPFDEPPAVN
jgi:hypothetical protein